MDAALNPGGLDPLLSHVSAAAVALVLLLAALAKLRDLALFRHAVDAYGVLPAPLVGAVAVALPLLEGAAGVLLLPAGTRAAGAVLAVAALGTATLGVVLALRAGRTDVDCGCGGSASLTLSWGLVARNAVLLVLAAGAAWPIAPRTTGWLDAAAGVLATLVLLGLYAVANQLLANHPRLRALRDQA